MNRAARWKIQDLYQLESTLIRTMRTTAGLSQDQLNKLIGLEKFNGSAKIERGRRRILWREFVKLAACTHVDFCQIFAHLDIQIEPDDLKQETKFVKILTRQLQSFFYKNVSGWKQEKINRLLSQRTPLRLIDVMAILAHDELYFSQFLSFFLTNEQWPEKFQRQLLAPNYLNEIIRDSYIGLFIRMSKLEKFQTDNQGKDNFIKAFSYFSGLGGEQLQNWLCKMQNWGVITEEKNGYRINIHQGRFAPDEESIRSYIGRVTDLACQVMTNKLNQEVRPAVIQSITLGPEAVKELLSELNSLRNLARRLDHSSTGKNCEVYVLQTNFLQVT